MIHLIELHPAALAILCYWLFSAIVGGMPDPDAKSGPGYRWVHNSLHILAGNLTTAVQAKYPEMAIPAGSSMEHRETTTVTTPLP
ncbi:hypothetical protein [Terriglobus roseus]|uniref:Uncharacterized protein n=1 Tax=Terriglobus roseus TaxID=392734 RepID=A0A1H4J4L7_9BACT|nr:hypothetical protein [Terriglobus roseus]SEB40502.1 hypothetical protein SAMN05443244_0313 [Terriglobus roseus]